MNALLLLIVGLQIGLVISLAAYLWRMLPHGGVGRAPFIRTKKRHVPLIAEALQFRPGDTVYELGSGDGRVVLGWARIYPDTMFIGVEHNPLLYAIASLRACITRVPNAAFRRQDFFATDISNATHVYAFTLPSVMSALLPKFQKDLKHSRVASHAFPMKKEHVRKIGLPGYSSPFIDRVLYIYEF